MKLLLVPAAFLVIASTSLAATGEEIYTLYRDSVVDRTMRIHVATFDATDGASYNRENCAQARDLFQSQPGVNTKFWCEPGRYKKKE